MQPDVFVPLLEEGSNTADENLSEWFARLLSAHLDPARQTEVHPSFAKVLGQLSHLDARILMLISEKQREVAESKYRKRVKRSTGEVIEWSKAFGPLDRQHVLLSLANLERLGLCTNEGMLYPYPDDVQKHPVAVRQVGWRITNFGHRLLSSCSPPGTHWADKEQEEFDRIMGDVRRNSRRPPATTSP